MRIGAKHHTHHENILAPILSFSQQQSPRPVARLEMLSSQEIKCIIAMNFNCTMGSDNKQRRHDVTAPHSADCNVKGA